ncbi:MAG: flagellar biosynthesis protein FlhB [Pseudomonadota bacterium]
MAEDQDQQDKTEDASDERREDFRERGDVAMSRDLTSTLALISVFAFLVLNSSWLFEQIRGVFMLFFGRIASHEITELNFSVIFSQIWISGLTIILPICLIPSLVAITSTLLQTKLNFSWSKLEPSFEKINPISGFARLLSMQNIVELLKGIAKMCVVATASWIILGNQINRLPSLINLPPAQMLVYFLEIIKNLFWTVCAALLVISGADYFYQWISLEKKMMMSKQDLKEEFKKKEVDPQIKNRIRKMGRDMIAGKMISATKKATVVITNPTHYAVALHYELGMGAPIIVAKGVDFLALKMRETAKEADVPIVENKPLARAMYKTLEVGDEIPEGLYKAVSEVIRYVFRLKGKNFGERRVS